MFLHSYRVHVGESTEVVCFFPESYSCHQIPVSVTTLVLTDAIDNYRNKSVMKSRVDLTRLKEKSQCNILKKSLLYHYVESAKASWLLLRPRSHVNLVCY